MRRLKTVLTALVMALVLVTCADYTAFAATGKSFILGKVNKAKRQTTLVRTTSGPALQLGTRSPADPPLVVNGSGKVTNLNADTVDGVDSSDLRTISHVFTHEVTSPTTYVDLTVPLPAGNYLVSYSADLNGADNGTVECYFVRDAADITFFGASRFSAGGGTPALTGSGFVSRPAGVELRLRCLADNTFNTSSDAPIQVAALRADTVNTGALVPTPATPRD
jgi:hypothetical protein